MSAWIVSKKHIDYIVTALVDVKITDKSPDDLGRMLWRECLNSVAYRYPNDGDGNRPGPAGFRDADVDSYTYEETPLLESGALAKTLGCYRYQSCEHPDWDTSEAQRLTGAIYDESAPFDNDTPWGWE